MIGVAGFLLHLFHEAGLISQVIEPIAVEFYFSLTGTKFHPFEVKYLKAFTLRDLEIKEWNSMVVPICNPIHIYYHIFIEMVNLIVETNTYYGEI